MGASDRPNHCFPIAKVRISFDTTLSLIDFYSNGRFSDGNYSKASGFIVFTDLAKDQGNKVEFANEGSDIILF